MSIDDRPTIAAPDDDPYLWLEEIEGERALAFVEQQSRLTLEAFGDAGICRRIATRWLRSTTGRTTFPIIAGAAVSSTISGRTRTIRAACGGEPRWKNFARRSPAWETVLDIDRLAAEENEDWLFAWTQPLPGSGARDRQPVARRQRRGDAARIRPRTPRPLSPTASPCRKPRAASNGSMPIRCCFRAPMATTWRRLRATPKPSGCGGAAPTWIKRR